MISKHIDLIAIAILLMAVSIFSTAKHVVVMTMNGPVRYFHMDQGRQVRIPRIPAPSRISLQFD